MNLQEWFKDKSHRKAARDLFDTNKTFQRMVEVLENESPLRTPLSPQGVSADDRSHRLGLIEGYEDALRKLKSLGMNVPAKPTTLQPTFEPPE